MSTSGVVKIYTDGGCNNGVASSKIPDRVGAWAYVIVGNDPIVTCQYITDTTNNRTEMLAVINAIESIEPDTHAIIYSDSGYVVNGLTNPSYLEKWIQNGWKTSANRPVENQDLWNALINAENKLQYRASSFDLKLIKGHGKNFEAEHNRWNTLVDKACTFIMVDQSCEDAGIIKLKSDSTKRSLDFSFQF